MTRRIFGLHWLKQRKERGPVSEQNKSQQGQGMVEYFVILTLIVLASIVAFSLLGQSIRSQSSQMSVQVSGGEAQGAAHTNAVGPGGNGKHCCGVRGNPPGPIDGHAEPG